MTHTSTTTTTMKTTFTTRCFLVLGLLALPFVLGAGSVGAQDEGDGPGAHRPPDMALASECMYHLKYLSLGFIQYTDAEGHFPPLGRKAFVHAVREGGFIEDAGIYQCPGHWPSPAAAGVHSDDYESWSAGNLDEIDAAVYQRVPILWDDVGGRHGQRCVAFLDGHVERMAEARFERVMAAAAEEFGLRR